MSAVSSSVTRGVPAAPGIAIGPYVIFERDSPALAAPAADAKVEITRLRTATDAVARGRLALAAQLRAEGHASEARIFEAHAEMARDPAVIDDAVERITATGVSASAAISAASAAVAEMLRGLTDPTLAARATDVLDVGDRIAREAAGLPAASVRLERPSIVVGDDLPPSITATLPRDRLLAIVLSGSSPTAHAAILARAYGIPAIVGVTDLRAILDGRPGSELAIDGATGEIVVSPDAQMQAEFAARQVTLVAQRAREAVGAGEPAVTRDGVRVSLLANIGNPAEAAPARTLGATGVGLLRTEFLFLERTAAPSEDEQAAAYGEAVAAFAPHPVIIRLLDVGGDKPISYLPVPREDNPFLGVRALRLAGSHRELFVSQMRACYRAARRGRVKVMAPMIADASDALLFIDLADEARATLGADEAGEVELGVMLEIPSAILAADSYFAKLSFGSLGTNDLLQYTLAADRGNAELARYRDGLHPAHLALIQLAVEAAGRHRLDLSVCGEMAGDPVAALALVGLGLRSLSMTASSIGTVKDSIRRSSLVRLEGEARAALRDASAAEVRERFTALLR